VRVGNRKCEYTLSRKFMTPLQIMVSYGKLKDMYRTCSAMLGRCGECRRCRK
jgi:hypothetical protein